MGDSTLYSLTILHPDTVGGKVIPPFSYIHPPFDSVPDFVALKYNVDSLSGKEILETVKNMQKENVLQKNKALVHSILQTEKPKEKIQFYPETKKDYSLVSIAFLVGLFLWSVMRFSDKEGWMDFVKSVWGGSRLREKLRDEKVYTSPFSIKFTVLGHVLFSIFLATLAYTARYTETIQGFFLIFSIAFSVSFLIQTLKIIVVSLGGKVFEISQNAAVHNHFIYVSHLLFSLILFISLSLLMIDIKSSIKIIHIFLVITTCILALYSIAQCLVNFSYKNKSHYFYILLYICTLEVLPLITLGGFIYKNLNLHY